MISFDPVTLASILTLAAAPSQICQIPKPAEINVIPKTEKLRIDTSRPMSDIQSQNIDTINPYGYDISTHTNGFMEGSLKLESSVSLSYDQAGDLPAYCIWYDQVNIEFNIEPKIVIAKEVASDPCMYDAVLTHEMKHVQVDRKIINKYAKTIGRKVFDGLKQRGFIAGPIASENLDATSARMRKTVAQLVEIEYRKLEIDRAEAQQAVDSLEEYKAVQAKCPNFRAP